MPQHQKLPKHTVQPLHHIDHLLQPHTLQNLNHLLNPIPQLLPNLIVQLLIHTPQAIMPLPQNHIHPHQNHTLPLLNHMSMRNQHTTIQLHLNHHMVTLHPHQSLIMFLSQSMSNLLRLTNLQNMNIIHQHLLHTNQLHPNPCTTSQTI